MIGGAGTQPTVGAALTQQNGVCVCVCVCVC